MQRLLFLAVTFCCLSFGSLCAQTASVSSVELPLLSNEDWTVYSDEENRLYYIDFEKLSVNLNAVVVRNERGEVVLKDEVFDLPVNTIYEIDFSHLPSGSYGLELQAFTGVIRKTISVKS